MKVTTGMDNEFEYEMAFSLCERDLEVAYLINSRFATRVNTFLYTENQKRINFGNQMKIFPAIYKSESRFVVVLYRSEYGQSRFTKLELDAIEDRSLNDTQDFLMFVRMDDAKLPAWFNSKYAYQGFSKDKIDSLVEKIEERLKSIGSNISYETPLQKAKLIKVQQEKNNERDSILNGADRRKENRDKEISRFFEAIDKQVEAIEKELPDLVRVVEKSKVLYNIQIGNYYLIFNFQENIDLEVSVWLRQYDGNAHHKKKEKANYVFDLELYSQTRGWRVNSEGGEFLPSEPLVESWINRVLEFLRQ